mgnify:CR=1 FL=1
MWCGTGKTVTFTISIFEDKTSLNVIVFPSLGLINQYSNDYFLNENFKKGFEKFNCLAFCSDSEKKLIVQSDSIRYSTDENDCKAFLEDRSKNSQKIVLVTYHSFEKFVNICIEMEDHQYEQGIEQKAKAGLNRLN